MTLCHLFGGITPFNVFDLELRHYVAFANAVDNYHKQNSEASRRG